MKIKCGKCLQVSEAVEVSTYARYRCTKCNAINEVTNVELKEWLGFNYLEYIKSIEKFIATDKFDSLRATNEIEALAGKLNTTQIEQLKSILKVGFNEGLSIRDIKNKIAKEIKLKDLKEVKNGEVTDRVLSYAERRPIMIARTESTRVAAEGALLNYKSNDIQEVSWLSSTGERTCDACNDLNGTVMSITEARNKIPLHPLCRCTFIPIVNSNANRNVILIEKVPQ